MTQEFLPSSLESLRVDQSPAEFNDPDPIHSQDDKLVARESEIGDGGQLRGLKEEVRVENTYDFAGCVVYHDALALGGPNALTVVDLDAIRDAAPSEADEALFHRFALPVERELVDPQGPAAGAADTVTWDRPDGEGGACVCAVEGALVRGDTDAVGVEDVGAGEDGGNALLLWIEPVDGVGEEGLGTEAKGFGECGICEEHVLVLSPPDPCYVIWTVEGSTEV